MGFTLVELIVIILLISILAGISSSLFFKPSTFQEQTVYTELTEAIRYGQRLAVASGCEVQVELSSTGYALQQHATSCTTGSFATISSQHPLSATNFSDVTISPSESSIIFDAMGRSSANVSITVGTFSFSVVAETGYAGGL